MKKLTRIAAAVGTVATITACQHGDPVSTAGDRFGEAAILNGNPSASTLPNGSASVVTSYGGFTTGIADAFGRSRTGAAGRRSQYFLTSSQYWEWFPEDARNASPTNLDPRLPAIQSTTAVIRAAVGILDLYPPNPASYPGGDYWEVYTGFDGLKPSTQYRLVFAQYRLKVNGMLDQQELLLTGAVTQPDELQLTPGVKAYTQTPWQDDEGGGCAPFPAPNTNPFIPVTFTTSTLGRTGGLDYCWLPGNGLWHESEYDLQAKSMVGRNDNVSYDLPNYNYVEVWEGDYGQGTGPVLRMQIAQDLDVNGKAIPNAYAPFPRPGGGTTSGNLTDKQTAFPVSPAILATLPGAVGLPDSLTLTLNNVQRLEGDAVYKVWYVRPATTAGGAMTAAPAPGKYVRTVGTVRQADSTTGTATFKGGPGTITFITSKYTRPFTDSLSYLLVTKEASAGATTPSQSQPFWVNIFKIPPVSAGGTVSFGSFNNGVGSVVYTPQGRTTGGVLGDTSTVLVDSTVGGVASKVRVTVFEGSTIEMRFIGLTRPPKGYMYRASLRPSARSGQDTTKVRDIGPLTGPNGEDLTSADTQDPNAIVSATGILNALVRYDAHANAPLGGSGSDQLCNYDRFRVYLVPKEGDPTKGLVRVFDVAFPGTITGAYSCR